MSFTADIYKEILSDVTAETKRTFPFAMRMVKFNNGIMVVFAVNIATRMRSAFLSVASEASKNRFPRWKGVVSMYCWFPWLLLWVHWWVLF